MPVRPSTTTPTSVLKAVRLILQLLGLLQVRGLDQALAIRLLPPLSPPRPNSYGFKEARVAGDRRLRKSRTPAVSSAWGLPPHRARYRSTTGNFYLHRV